MLVILLRLVALLRVLVLAWWLLLLVWLCLLLVCLFLVLVRGLHDLAVQWHRGLRGCWHERCLLLQHRV